MSCEVVLTRSGATAMRHRASGETMHPGTGNAVEPVELYVGPSRLEARLREPGAGALVLFDVGLGAASNAIAAFRVSEAAASDARRLEIVSFDNDLAPLQLALDPAYAARFGLAEGSPEHAAARALLGTGRFETPRTTWRLAFGDLRTTVAAEPEGSADIVFWDMYSAKNQPSLWTPEAFRSLRRACRDGATLHTYSAATSVRSALLLGGFAVGEGGPTGDRAETTIAATHVGALASPLGARWLARLGRSPAAFAPGTVEGPEAHQAALAQVRACPQFGAVGR